MADEVRFQANQRLDLIDTTRWKQAIQDALGEVLGKLLGNPEHYTGVARDTDFRPAIFCNFQFTIVGAPPTLTIQVDQNYTIGADDYKALIYDKDGYRLTGNNAVTPKLLVSAGGAGPYYIIVRRVVTNTSLESRKHYSAALGEYTANTNTRTYDDWEVAESLVSADATVVLRDAGWIDVGTFTIIAGPTIGVITPVENVMMQQLNPLTWVGAPPDPDRPLLNGFEWLNGLSQIVRRMRFGAGAVTRDWFTDILSEACFEEGGGLRFCRSGIGLVDVFVRSLTTFTNQVLVTNNNMGDADDLLFFRAKAVISGDLAAGGYPDPGGVPPTGFIYSDNIDGVNNPVDIEKPWSIDASAFMPGLSFYSLTDVLNVAQSEDPWSFYCNQYSINHAAGATDNMWYIDNSLAGPPVSVPFRWRIEAVAPFPGIASPALLFIPISLPHGCLFYQLDVRLRQLANMNANHFVLLDVYERDADTATLLASNTPGQQWLAGSPANRSLITSWAGTVINNENSYFAVIYWSNFGGVGGFTEDAYAVGNAIARTRIREASHVY